MVETDSSNLFTYYYQVFAIVRFSEDGDLMTIACSFKDAHIMEIFSV